MGPQIFLWASGAHLTNGSWSWQQKDCGNLRPKAEDRLPGGLTHHSLTGSQQPGLQSQPSQLPLRSCQTGAAIPATQEEEIMVSRKGIMPDSRAGQRASQPTPVVCQLLAEPEEHKGRQEVWWRSQLPPRL